MGLAESFGPNAPATGLGFLQITAVVFLVSENGEVHSRGGSENGRCMATQCDSLWAAPLIRQQLLANIQANLTYFTTQHKQFRGNGVGAERGPSAPRIERRAHRRGCTPRKEQQPVAEAGLY